ncbi:MAG: hypothetical protein LBU44_09635 [Mediterranea sp.]|jgi:hypothetical protein|nr:hypothetical protein [Mediterranea sp.]
MTDNIQFTVKGEVYTLTNSWEKISSYHFLTLVRDFECMARGELSPAIVRVNFVCNVMGWNPAKIKDEEAFQNLALLAEQVTFPFVISYPDNDEALSVLEPEVRKLCKRIPPERLSGVAIARYLARLDYKFTLDCCFCRQLVPVVKVDDEFYYGYRIDTSFNMLTCSLKVLQYIEVHRIMGKPDMLPLLAAILYHPDTYSSESAHQLAEKFATLPAHELQAIAFNFQAFNNYLFTQTEFSIFTAGKDEKPSAITTGALESLYNLSSNGCGNITVVEQMNLIQYLTILRKKLIDSVHRLHAVKMQKADIAKETGLPIHIINKIL